MTHVSPHDSDFHETFATLQTLLLTLEGVESFLQEVAELAARVVSPPVSCGITARYDGHAVTVSSTDSTARALDESQYGVGEGTCLHAMDSGEVVDVPDADAETRWPAYFEQARTTGLRSSLSLPLVVSGASIGAINLYSCDRTHAFDGAARRRAEVFASQASTALALSIRQVRSGETNRQLERALTSRSVIDQALGILIAQERCTPTRAFELLRSHSQNNNIKLRDVATELVHRTSGADPA